MVKLRGGFYFSIAQLDEAVLRFPSVVSYGAEIRDENGADLLDVTVRVSDGADKERLEQSIAAIEPFPRLLRTVR